MSHADLETYLVELLMKQDQMSMAASIESRVPFLDHVFVERVAAMLSRIRCQMTCSTLWAKSTVGGAAAHATLGTVIDSYIADIKEVGADSQAVAGWNGPGPFKIANNYLEGPARTSCSAAPTRRSATSCPPTSR